MSDFKLDPQARARVQAACDVVNGEIAVQRRNVLLTGIGAAMVVLPLVAAYPDAWRSIFFAALIAMAAAVGHGRRVVSRSYKQLVVGRIVKALGAGLTYRAESSLTRKAFLGMDLFADSPSSFESEDEISGRKANVAYSVHEVRATRTEGKKTVTVFAGLMIRLDFNKNFRGHTTVVPNGSRGRSATLVGRILGGSARKAQVTLENPDFEQIFDVYSTDDQEARYLLTPKLMELILSANAVQSMDMIRLAFVQNSLYVAMPMPGNRLEAGLNAKVTPDGAVGELAEVVRLAERLVDTLDLETRLWSKA